MAPPRSSCLERPEVSPDKIRRRLVERVPCVQVPAEHINETPEGSSEPKKCHCDELNNVERVDLQGCDCLLGPRMFDLPRLSNEGAGRAACLRCPPLVCDRAEVR
jgi:hypothetical protein